MGRYYYDKKTETDDCLDIDIFWLKKHGYLRASKWGGIKWVNGWGENSIGIQSCPIGEDDSYIRFYYAVTDRDTREKEELDYKIPLTTTPCNFGYWRYWFICPWHKNGVYCGRRVGKLYKGDNKYFACRHCYELTYHSRNENRRYSWLPAFKYLDLDKKITDLREDMKRTSYAGKPTRKMRRLIDLRMQATRYSFLLKDIEGL